MSVSTSRRSLLRAGAWAAPAVVIATASPAYATSGATPQVCAPTPYELVWSASSWEIVASGAASTVGLAKARALDDRAVNPEIVVTVESTFMGGMEAHQDSSTGQNMRVSPSAVGGTRNKGLALYQRYKSNARGVGAEASQTLTFHFSEKVRGLAFTITDIDGAGGQFHDHVTLSPAPATVTHATRRRWVPTGLLTGRYEDVATTQGAGTSAKPLTSVTRSAVDNTGSLGNVRVAFQSDQEIRSFSLTFYNGLSGSLDAQGQQAIYLSDFRFTTDICR